MILNEWKTVIKDIHQQIFYGSVLKINHRIYQFQSICAEGRPPPANVDKTRKASTDSEAGLFGKVRLASIPSHWHILVSVGRYRCVSRASG